MLFAIFITLLMTAMYIGLIARKPWGIVLAFIFGGIVLWTVT